MTKLNYYNKLTYNDFNKCSITDLQYFRKRAINELMITNKDSNAYKMIHDNLVKLKLYKPEVMF